MPNDRRAPVRTTTPGARATRGKSVVPRLLLGGALVYLLALAAFALLSYDGSQPGSRDVVTEFHAFLGVGPSNARAQPLPPKAVQPRPKPIVATPPPAPPPLSVREPTPLDRVADTLRQVRTGAPALKRMDRGLTFDETRIHALGRLSDARDLLNEILDENPDHRRANDLWDRLQALMAAFRKL